MKMFLLLFVTVLFVDFRKKFVIYNSSPHERVEIVRIWVSNLPITVYDSKMAPAVCQVSPYFTTHVSISHDKFKVRLYFLQFKLYYYFQFDLK